MSIKKNSLFETLELFTKLYHKHYSLDFLISNLPIKKDESEPELFSHENLNDNFARAAKKAGLASKIIKQQIVDIDELTLPLILIKNDKSGIIVDSISGDKTKANILMASSGDAIYEVDIQTLIEEYSGYLILISKRFEYDKKKRDTLKTHKHWFWDSIKLSRDIYIDVIKASLIINFFVLSVPLFSMNVYDRVIPNNAIETLWVLAIGVMIVLFFDALLKFMRTYFIEIAAKKSDILISAKLFEHVMNMRSEHTPSSVGSFATHFKEFDSIRNFLTSSVLTLMIDLPFLIIFLIVIYYIGGVIVLVPLITIFIILSYTFFISKPLYKNIEETYTASAKKNSILIETLNALESIKVFNAFNHTQYEYEEANGYIAKKNIKTKMLSTSIATITGVLIQLNTVFVVVVGAYLIQELEMSMGALIAVVILSSRTISPIGQVASLISSYEQTKMAYKTLDEIMDKESEREESKQYINLSFIKGDIEFIDVSFRYPNETQDSLKNVSFKINSGQKYAILGKIGSGKSTIIKLILGLYKPQSGRVLIDGLDINQIDPILLRDNISYVPQDITLFSGTIKDNISYGNLHIEDEQIVASAKISNLHKYIEKSSQGFETPVIEGGKNLSGGQKQSIAIARAFVKDKPIAILDEPTNSMDSPTETITRDNTMQKIKGKTCLLITHKLSMLELVDKVIIIDDGKITFDGLKGDIQKRISDAK